MIVRFFGRHGVDEHGHLHQVHAGARDVPPSTFPPALVEEARATIAKRRAEKRAPPKEPHDG